MPSFTDGLVRVRHAERIMQTDREKAQKLTVIIPRDHKQQPLCLTHPVAKYPANPESTNAHPRNCGARFPGTVLVVAVVCGG